jgi:hypothetical protein
MDQNPDREELSQSKRIQRLRQAMYSRSLSDKLRPRERTPLRPIPSGVPSDFTARPRNEQAETITETRVAEGVHVAHRVVLWILYASIALFAVASVAFGAYFFVGPGFLSASPKNVDITVQGPLSVSSGEPVRLQVTVRNRNSVALELANLVVHYPDGTRSAADFLTTLTESTHPLGSIDQGGERQGTVVAVFIGNQGDEGHVDVELEYRTADSNAIFVAKSGYDFTFTTSPVSVTLEGNTEVISGQPITLTATIRSAGVSQLRDVVVDAHYPFGFTESEVSPKRKGDLWELGDLNPGDTRTIVIQGAIVGQERDDRVFTVRAGTRTDTTHKAIDTTLAESNLHTTLSKPFLALTTSVNQTAVESASIQPGTSVNVVIGYRNTLATPITNAVIVAKVSGSGIASSTVFRATDGFYRSADKTILFDKTTTRGELATIAPGGKGTVSFSFTAPTQTALDGVTNPTFDFSVNAAGKRTNESGVPETLQSAITESVKYATAVKLFAATYYALNPFGSTGPKPPQVGKETTYAIVFSVTNTTNSLKNAVVKAQLPPYVRWTGVFSPAQEHVSFSTTDGTLQWDLGEVLGDTGENQAHPPRQIAIAIAVTPSQSQVGQAPDLVYNPSLSAVDVFTDTPVTATTRNPSTDLVNEYGEAGGATVADGKVIE